MTGTTLLHPDAVRWYRKPKRAYFTRTMYDGLIFAFKTGVISRNIFFMWFEKSFSGFMPDWVYLEMVRRDGFRGFPKMFPKMRRFRDLTCRIEPCFALSPDRVHPLGANVKDRRLVDFDHTITDRASDHNVYDAYARILKCGSRQEIYNLLKNRLGQMSIPLRDRQRVGAREVSALLAANQDLALSCLLPLMDLGTDAFSIWCILCVSCPDYIRVLTWVLERVPSLDALTMRDFMKRVHQCVRRCRISPIHGIDYHKFMYLDVSLGRYDAPSQPPLDSLIDRCLPLPTGQRSGFYDCVEHNIFEEHIRCVITEEARRFASYVKDYDDGLKMMLEEYYHRGATGSIGGRFKKMINAGSDFDKYCNVIDKTDALSSLSYKQLNSLLHTDGPLETTLVWKMESGRNRMLLPGTFEHWLQESVLVAPYEDRFFAFGDGYALQQTNYESYLMHLDIIEQLHGKVVLDIDYADFNIAHTKERMALFWQALADAVDRSTLVTPDLSYCMLCRILASRLMRMFVHLGNTEPTSEQKRMLPQLQNRTVACLRGLWSGWRTTTLLNNIMNRSYYDGALRTIGARVCGINLRCGDDAHSVVPDEYTALRVCCLLNDHGLVLNAKKQFIGQGIGEFLRITYEDNRMVASYVRSVASYVSSDLQSPPRAFTLNYVKGSLTALNGLLRRCPDHRYRWWMPMIGSLTRVEVLKNGVLTHCSIPLEQCCLSVDDGGLGVHIAEYPYFHGPTISHPREINVGALRKKLDIMQNRAAARAGSHLHDEFPELNGSVIREMLIDMQYKKWLSAAPGVAVRRFNAQEVHSWIARFRNQCMPSIQQVSEVLDDKQTCVSSDITSYFVNHRRDHYASAYDRIDGALAAATHGLVNLVPKLVDLVRPLSGTSERVSTFLNMIPSGKRAALRSAQLCLGDDLFWAYLSGSIEVSTICSSLVPSSLNYFSSVVRYCYCRRYGLTCNMLYTSKTHLEALGRISRHAALTLFYGGKRYAV